MTVSYRPAGPPPPQTPEARARILSAVIGAVALAATLVVALASNDTARGLALGLPAQGTQGSQGAETGQGTQGGNSGRGGGSAASRGSTGGQRSSISAAELKAHFPLPPGTTTSTLHLYPGPGERDFQVRASFASVVSFYRTHLPALGVSLDDHPAITTDSDGTIVGYDYALHTSGTPPINGYLAIDDNYLNQQPGIVTIKVTIN